MTQDLQKAHDDSDNTSEKEIGKTPSINTEVTLKETPHTHKYATKAKGVIFYTGPEYHSQHGNRP